MYAIIQLGSTQFKVAEGDVINSKRINEKEGKSITVDKVLLFAKGTDVRIGQPYLKDVKVTAKIVKHDLADKVITHLSKRRQNSARKVGHRQKLTSLNITKIAA